MQFNVALPSFSDISDKKELRKIKTYLAVLNDQLRYMMSNLDEENLSDNLSEVIKESHEAAILSKESLIELENSFSSVKQDAAEIDLRVTALQNDYSSLSITAGKINWLVSGNTISDFSITENAISAISSQIDLTGVVKFNDLSSAGHSVINGSNIMTGSLSADKLSVDDLYSLGADIAGWKINEDRITSEDEYGGSFTMFSGKDDSGFWMSAYDRYGNNIFSIKKDGSGYISGNFIAQGSISCSKIVSDDQFRLDLSNNGHGMKIGGSIHFTQPGMERRIYFNNKNQLVFDVAAGYDGWSLGLTNTQNEKSLTVFSSLGNTVGKIYLN